MTVCVAAKVHDCIVFAADSAATLSRADSTGNQQVLNVYNNADKVFNLHRKLPLVAMTCGLGHIGGRSISSLAKELRKELMNGTTSIDSNNYTVKGVAAAALDFLKGKYENPSATRSADDYFEFWVGGYGSDNEHGEIWKISIVGGQMQDLEQLNKPGEQMGLFWGGQGEAITRLVLGVDPQIIDALMASGLDNPTAVQIYDVGKNMLQAPVLSPTMPIIDTIRLVRFLVNSTIGYFSFKYGSDIVGGATDIATVTKYEGFRWIDRKHYYPAELNREDNGHVC